MYKVLPLTPAECILTSKLYLSFNNKHKKFKSSNEKQFVDIFAPLPNLDPSSINHVAKAKGVKYIPKFLGIIFLLST